MQLSIRADDPAFQLWPAPARPWRALGLQAASRVAPPRSSSSFRPRLAFAARLRPGPARAPTAWRAAALPFSFALLRRFAAASLPAPCAWLLLRAASLPFPRAAA